jgi:hypothetical protein
VTMKLMMMKGDTGVVPADIMVVGPESQVTEDVVSISDRVGLHDPTSFDMIDAVLVENNGADDGVPKLEDNMGEDSDNEADDDESVTAEFLGYGGETALQELCNILEAESSEEDVAVKVHQPPLRRSKRTTAGVKNRDTAYNWNYMNLSVSAALNQFGEVDSDACKHELVQLFVKKKVLEPVKWEDLMKEQQAKAV